MFKPARNNSGKINAQRQDLTGIPALPLVNPTYLCDWTRSMAGQQSQAYLTNSDRMPVNNVTSLGGVVLILDVLEAGRGRERRTEHAPPERADAVAAEC